MDGPRPPTLISASAPADALPIVRIGSAHRKADARRVETRKNGNLRE